jgi:hypothetical protein
MSSKTLRVLTAHSAYLDDWLIKEGKVLEMEWDKNENEKRWLYARRW